MRILHTADLHLGRQFMGLSLEEDHEVVLGQIVDALVTEEADVLVIAGDIFDRASPPNSAIRQFNRFLRRVADETQAAVVMISGNHDSGDRIEAMSVFSAEGRALVRGVADKVEAPLVLDDGQGPVAFSALPFSYEYAAREVLDDPGLSSPADVIGAQIASARGLVPEGARWVVVAHAFVTGGAVGETERDLTRVGGIQDVPTSVFDGANYVALGHLHKPQQMGSPHIRYSGAPLAYGFDEAGGEKSMTLVDLGPEGVEVQLVPFAPLRRVRSLTGSLEDLLAGAPSDDFVQWVRSDDEPLIDPMKRLREVYPNACHIVPYSRHSAPEVKAMQQGRAAVAPIDMIGDFLELMRGERLTSKEAAIVAGHLHDIAAGEDLA